MNIEKQRVLPFLDLSAAFDTIDNEALFKLILSRFGISGIALNWIGLYLAASGQKGNITSQSLVSLRDPYLDISLSRYIPRHYYQ